MERAERAKLEKEYLALQVGCRVWGLLGSCTESHSPPADVQAHLSQSLTLHLPHTREQAKALSAPGAALNEVRQLREELFSLRRDKALAEGKEAEVRRELSAVREQVGGAGAWGHVHLLHSTSS